MESTFLEIGLIVGCASVLAWLAAQSKQPIIMGYLLCGILAGPWGFGLVAEVGMIDTISRIGITLLLFLAGMVLHPARLLQLFRMAAVVTLGCSMLSWGLVFTLFRFCGLAGAHSAYAAAALMFSSTILVVKLLPTTTLHQRHMGSVCIAVLIAQDVLAVVLLLFVQGGGEQGVFAWSMHLLLKGLVFVALAVTGEQWILRRMMARAESYHEVLYMLCLGWCLGLAVLAETAGLSYEVGAFVAGVALARSPLSRFLSDELKPIRDFFLMFFFFVLGAKLDFLVFKEVWVPAALAAALILVSRPVILRLLFRGVGEGKSFSKEVGLRLGQGSEFGMIMAVTAESAGRINPGVSQLIQLAVIMTMVVSSYLVVYRLPSPLGVQNRLKQD